MRVLRELILVCRFLSALQKKQQLLFTKEFWHVCARVCACLCVCVCVLIVQGWPVKSVRLMRRKIVSTQESFKPIIIWTPAINPRFIVSLGPDMLTDTCNKKKKTMASWSACKVGGSSKKWFYSAVCCTDLQFHSWAYYLSAFYLFCCFLTVTGVVTEHPII